MISATLHVVGIYFQCMQALNRKVKLSNVLLGISASISDVIKLKPEIFLGLRLLIRRHTVVWDKIRTTQI